MTDATLNDEGRLAGILRTARTIAVVGLSPDPSRPSHAIGRYLVASGYRVLPVNPAAVEVLGLRSYPDLASIPSDVEVDVVDVFRRSEFVAPVARQAIDRGTRLFWMQDGVVDEASADALRAAGIDVAMDRCIYRDRESLRLAGAL